MCTYPKSQQTVTKYEMTTAMKKSKQKIKIRNKRRFGFEMQCCQMYIECRLNMLPNLDRNHTSKGNIYTSFEAIYLHSIKTNTDNQNLYSKAHLEKDILWSTGFYEFSVNLVQSLIFEFIIYGH